MLCFDNFETNLKQSFRENFVKLFQSNKFKTNCLVENKAKFKINLL